MTKLLTLQVTEASFDFDDLDFTVDEQQEVINSVVGNVFEVEVDDDDDDEAIADVLVEEVTDYTGWCIISLDFVHILKWFPFLILTQKWLKLLHNTITTITKIVSMMI